MVHRTLAFTLVISMILIIAAINLGSLPAGAAEKTWTGDIEIKADGTISPTDAPVAKNGNYYKLKAHVVGTVSINASSVTFDGCWYTISEKDIDSDPGLVADGTKSGLSGITVKNLIIDRSKMGMKFVNVSGSSIKNNWIIDNDMGDGIVVEDSDGNLFSTNVIRDSYLWGMKFTGCDKNKVIYSTIKSSEYLYFSILIEDSNSNQIKVNHLGNGIYLVNASKNTVSDNNIYTDGEGIYLSDRSCDNTIRANDVQGGRYGLFIYSECDRNTVQWNAFISNWLASMWVGDADDTVIEDNTFLNNTKAYITESQNVEYCDNIHRGDGGLLVANTSGILIRGNLFNTDSDYPLLMSEVYDAEIVYNQVKNNTIGLYFSECDNITMKYNVVRDNDYIFFFDLCTKITIHFNDFVDNDKAFDPLNGPDGNETWDNGEGKGNYWSDYKGSDTDGDWIGDTSLPHNGVDHYPLMEAYNWG